MAITDNNGYVLSPLPVAPVNETDMTLLPKGLQALKQVAKKVRFLDWALFWHPQRLTGSTTWRDMTPLADKSLWSAPSLAAGAPNAPPAPTGAPEARACLPTLPPGGPSCLGVPAPVEAQRDVVR